MPILILISILAGCFSEKLPLEENFFAKRCRAFIYIG